MKLVKIDNVDDNEDSDDCKVCKIYVQQNKEIVSLQCMDKGTLVTSITLLHLITW